VIRCTSLSLFPVCSCSLALLTLLHGGLRVVFVDTVHIHILGHLVRIFYVGDFLLKGRLDLETPLQVVEGRVFEATVADQVVQLVAGLDDV
jgi:hypothetical protein